MHLTWIPRGAIADVQADEAFDPDYMAALFAFGHARMHEGTVWINAAQAMRDKAFSAQAGGHGQQSGSATAE